jgi:CheY-like chemotaxis protein
MLNQAMKLEAIGRMTDGISHDFNNLLTVIRGNLRFLKQDMVGDNEDHKELIEDALSAAQDGADLIKRLLAFSRRQELDVQTININNRLVAMERLIQRSVPEISIRLELDDEIGNVLVDTNRLESAVLNMVTNARDAMPNGGSIVISTTEETLNKAKRDDDLAPGNYVVLTVTDDGVGMNDETKRQAIEPFFTTKSIETGTGLGLTMVNEFVQQCGGKLHIKSAPGKGTSIKLLFPSVEATDDFMIEIEVNDDLPTGEETILVVEDRENVRRFACRTLIRLGYEIHEAENASVAMEILQQYGHIDLLFTDIVMPGDTNGRELAQFAMKTWPAIRVLLTTGMEPENETKIPEDIPLLPKPYSSEQLAQRIRAVLDAEDTN